MSRNRVSLKAWARGGVCLLLAAGLVPAIFAAPPPAKMSLSIDQLDNMLHDMSGQGDAWIAHQITRIELTERVSGARLAQWEAQLPGERSREALMAVADLSAFLSPPAADTPKLPPPGADTQQQILARCMDYIRQKLHQLPNYFALRTTVSFEFTTAQRLDAQKVTDGLFQSKDGQKIKYRALGPAKSGDSPDEQYFWLGSYAQEVTYRGNSEVVNAASGANGPSRALPYAMTSSGEFGSVLQVILVDASQSQMAWDHWEQGSNGPLAIFRYAVPSERSHVSLNFETAQSEYPAYHGEVGIDPESGTVWRITVLATGSGSGFLGESSIAVEFAPAEIAGITYICPVRSVAIVRFFDPFEYANTAHTPSPFQISINDVGFTNYHQFRSESHIVSSQPGRSH